MGPILLIPETQCGTREKGPTLKFGALWVCECATRGKSSAWWHGNGAWPTLWHAKHTAQNNFRLCIGNTNRCCAWTRVPSLRWDHYVHGNIPKFGRFLNSKQFWSHAFGLGTPFAEPIKMSTKDSYVYFFFLLKVLGIESRVLCVLEKPCPGAAFLAPCGWANRIYIAVFKRTGFQSWPDFLPRILDFFRGFFL